MKRSPRTVPGLFMSWLTCVLCVMSLVVPATRAHAQHEAAEPAVAEAPKPNKLDLDLDKEVLVFVEPVREDGTIDYIAALNMKYSEGVTNENNAFRGLLLALPELNDYNREHYEAMAESLGIDRRRFAERTKLVLWGTYAEQAGLDEVEADRLKSLFWEGASEALDDEHIQAWLELNEPVLRYVADVVDRPRYWAPLHGWEETEDFYASDLLYGMHHAHQGHYRLLAYQLRGRALLAAREGEMDKAVASLRAIRRLALHQSTEPLLISGLIAMTTSRTAVDTLTGLLKQQPLDPETLKRLAKVWTQLPPLDPVSQKIAGSERVAALDGLMQIAAGREDYVAIYEFAGGLKREDGHSKMIRSSKFELDAALKQVSRSFYLLSRVMGADTYAHYAKASAVYAHHLDQAEREAEEALTFYLGNEKVINPLLSSDEMTRHLTNDYLDWVAGGCRFARTVEFRTIAGDRLAIVAIAAERYRLDHDKPPESLEALVPEYLASVPIDPMDGRPLRYRVNDRGFVVYSIGTNLEDDQGFQAEDSDEGDLVLRVEPASAPAP